MTELLVPKASIAALCYSVVDAVIVGLGVSESVAENWVNSHVIPVFGVTARELVESSRTHDALAYVEHLAKGGSS